MMLQQFLKAISISSLAIIASSTGSVGQDKAKTIAMTQFVEHAELNNVRKGALEALSEAGFNDKNTKIIFESAQGDIATATQIATRFAAMSPDVMIAIATPSAQTMLRSGTTSPIVFGAVTDPLAARIVKSLSKPDGNVTGTSAKPNVGQQLDLIKTLTPGVKRIGVLFNPSEMNSKVIVDEFLADGKKRGYEIVTETVTSSADVLSAASNLVGRVDAIYIPNDSTVVSGLEAAVGIANSNKLPLYTADTNGVNRGAFAAIGFDYFQVGRDTGQIAAQILRGEKPGDIPVIAASKTSILFNQKTASTIGVKIPTDLLKQAARIVE